MRFIFVFLLCAFGVFADLAVQHTVVFSVAPTNQMGQIIGPAPLFLVKGESSCVCHNTYSVMTNEQNKKISAFLDQDMPQGSILTVYLAPPQGARTLGVQALSATPVDLVVEISQVSETELPVIYTFTSTVKTGVVTGQSRVITYTMTDG